MKKIILLLLLPLFFVSYASARYEISYLSGLNQTTLSLRPGIYSINWDLFGEPPVIDTGNNISAFDFNANIGSCQSSYGSDIKRGYNIEGQRNLYRSYCSNTRASDLSYLGYISSNTSYTFPINTLTALGTTFGQFNDDPFSLFRIYTETNFNYSTNFGKLDNFLTVYYQLDNNNGMSSLPGYGNAITGNIVLGNVLDGDTLSIEFDEYLNPYFAPGYGISLFGPNGELQYYEFSKSNFYDNSSVNLYSGIFFGTVNSIDLTTSGYNQYISQGGFHEPGFDTNFRSIVGKMSGDYFYFSVYDCYLPGLYNVTHNCTSSEDGRISIYDISRGALSDRKNGAFFSKIDTTSDLLYFGGFGGSSTSYTYQSITYEDMSFFEDSIGFDFTGTSPDYTYTPPEYGSLTGTSSSGFNYTGNTVNSIITGLTTNIFGGVTLSGNNLFLCSPEFSSGNFQLHLSEIPVIQSIYSVSEYIGIELPDTDIFGPFSCSYGAYNYGKQNIVPVQQITIGSGTSIIETATDQQNNGANAFINFLLAIPAIFIYYKILNAK